jgi:hypothetical protein
LTAHGVSEDDARVISVTARWGDAVPAGLVRVIIEPATP